jgi:hypothetical protein
LFEIARLARHRDPHPPPLANPSLGCVTGGSLANPVPVVIGRNNHHSRER